MSSVIKYTRSALFWCKPSGTMIDSFRRNGPCIVQETGEVYFSQLDHKSHNRKKGPCAIQRNGAIAFANRYGIIHRTDGPAVINADGTKGYWVNRVQLTAEEFFLKYGVL